MLSMLGDMFEHMIHEYWYLHFF